MADKIIVKENDVILEVKEISLTRNLNNDYNNLTNKPDLNNFLSAENIIQGNNIILEKNGNNITINSSGGGSGSISNIGDGVGVYKGMDDGVALIKSLKNTSTLLIMTDNTANQTIDFDVDGTVLNQAIDNRTENFLVASNIIAGTNITLSTSGKNVTINASGGGGGSSSFNIDANSNILGTNNYTATTGIENTILATTSFHPNITGAHNVLIGQDAGAFIGSGNNNILIGYQAHYSNANDNCLAIGYQSQNNMTVGNNISIGNFSLTRGNGTNNIAIGFFGLYNHSYNNCIGIGNSVVTSGDNQIQLGDSSQTTYVYGTVQDRSDERDKAEIQDCDLGLDFILALNPIKWKWNYREDYIEKVVTEYEEYDDVEKIDENGNKTTVKELVKKTKVDYITHDNDGSKTRNRFHYGFGAGQVEKWLIDNNKDFGGFQNHSLKGGKDLKTLGYNEFKAPIVKSIHELNEKIETQQQQINDLIDIVKTLQNQIKDLK